MLKMWDLYPYLILYVPYNLRFVSVPQKFFLLTYWTTWWMLELMVGVWDLSAVARVVILTLLLTICNTTTLAIGMFFISLQYLKVTPRRVIIEHKIGTLHANTLITYFLNSIQQIVLKLRRANKFSFPPFETELAASKSYRVVLPLLLIIFGEKY